MARRFWNVTHDTDTIASTDLNNPLDKKVAPTQEANFSDGGKYNLRPNPSLSDSYRY